MNSRPLLRSQFPVAAGILLWTLVGSAMWLAFGLAVLWSCS